MVWCLMASSHYLNQWWLLISEILQHLRERRFKVGGQLQCTIKSYENYSFKSLPNIPGADEFRQAVSYSLSEIIFQMPSLSQYEGTKEILTHVLQPTNSVHSAPMSSKHNTILPTFHQVHLMNSDACGPKVWRQVTWHLKNDGTLGMNLNEVHFMLEEWGKHIA